MAPVRLTREQAVGELGQRWRPGDHVTLIGPTGRGKSTLVSQLLPRVQHDSVILLCPKGPDPAFTKHGLAVRQWPPKRGWRDQFADIFAGVPERHAQRPIIWRIELPFAQAGGYASSAGVYQSVLDHLLARPNDPPDSVAVVLDDSRVISDTRYMGLEAAVVGNMILARGKRVSVLNNYQAPRWVPREGLDQGTQILMWRNRDRDVIRRLAEIGDLDLDAVKAALNGLDYHEALWIDGRTDDLFIVGQ